MSIISFILDLRFFSTLTSFIHFFLLFYTILYNILKYIYLSFPHIYYCMLYKKKVLFKKIIDNINLILKGIFLNLLKRF